MLGLKLKHVDKRAFGLYGGQIEWYMADRDFGQDGVDPSMIYIPKSRFKAMIDFISGMIFVLWFGTYLIGEYCDVTKIWGTGIVTWYSTFFQHAKFSKRYTLVNIREYRSLLSTTINSMACKKITIIFGDFLRETNNYFKDNYLIPTSLFPPVHHLKL